MRPEGERNVESVCSPSGGRFRLMMYRTHGTNRFSPKNTSDDGFCLPFIVASIYADLRPSPSKGVNQIPLTVDR